MLAVPKTEHLDISDSDGATGRWGFAHRAFEYAVVRACECALLDSDIADDVKAVHVDLRVGEGSEPAAVEFDAGCLSLAAQSTWRLKDDVICEHFRKPVDIVGVKATVPLSNASRAVIVIENLLGRCRSDIDV
jgi:hypothetical protein